MSRCTSSRALLAGWRPDGAAQLPDAVALHLDACPECRAVFDARFPPVAPVALPEATRLASRLVVPRARGLGIVLAAAAVVLLLPLLPATPTPEAVAQGSLEECLLTVDPPPEGGLTCEV